MRPNSLNILVGIILQPGGPGTQNQTGRSRRQHRDLKADRHRARADNQIHRAREPETLEHKTRPAPKATGRGRLGQQDAAGEGKKELSKIFEDV
jgi:hypothetical protein